MTHSDDDAKTTHAPGSRPSTRPSSDEPQTITAPTPPVAWSSGPPDRTDLADGESGEDTPESSRHEGEPHTPASHDD